MGVAAAIVLVLVLAGFYLSWRATRLDRLHHRVETSWAALDAALLRRGAAVLDLAAADVLDPDAARDLAAAATAARRAGAHEREFLESRLSIALRRELERTGLPEAAAPFLREITGSAKGVHLARTFHNDAVADTRRARRSRLVRGLRLAGSAALPDFFEMDDHPPRTGRP
ncbi:hypothetical protein IDM40_01720 [Nocardiopsis sp. HNM0947]|uniref:NUDIX hydrolase n=1 Tax=Nocardiopsis coralli TaxID=2772213 RepID=A0ABR9P0T2_9ACTN|nr:hypothetical protein [Nocardiopsis coralli]MBE2997426.1 hypothetical protein [Nocardiopsis coralli]